MKKSDIAIYISAILTLMLTTFVVFSTQKVTYETQIDDIIKKQKKNDKSLAMADKNTTVSQDTDSALFRTKANNNKQNDTGLVIKKDSTTDADKKLQKTSDTTLTVKQADKAQTPDKKISDKKDVTFTKASKPAIKKTTTPAVRKKNITKHKHKKTVKRSNRRYNRTKSKYYTVKWGDTLWKIAARYNTTTIKLIRHNSFKNPNKIYPGMKVRIP